jgi:membrane protein implicated in regulation of membrane protease activity
VLLIAGLVGLFLLESPWTVVAVCAAAVVEVAELAFWLRFLRRYRVRTGAEGMIGERAEVIDAFSAGSGRVRILGEIWTARADPETPLPAGAQVRVSGVEGLTLTVEPDEP